MNIPEYLELAKKSMLNEHAGSEGMCYHVQAKKGLKALENENMTISEVETKDGISSARVCFGYPRDYGFALNTIKEALPEIEIISLGLVY